MDRSDTAVLIGETWTQDSIGQYVATQTRTTVFCNVSSVSRTEWHDAGQQGLNAAYVLTMFLPDYSGQRIVEYNSVKYSVYRTYQKKDETIELYLELKAGV